MNKFYLSVSAILIILSVSVGVILFSMNHSHNYMPFTWDGRNCITYYDNCTCIGELLVLESYPPQYRCNGFESCQEINITECRLVPT